MQEPEPPVIQPFNFVFSWRRFLVHCLIMGFCVLLGLMTWYFGKPHSIRFYETKSEQLLATSIAPGIDMALDMLSSVAVKEGRPLQAELFKGNVYFDIQKNAANQLEVKVGDAIIKDFGTRFSIQLYKNGSGHIAVTDGYIKIHVSSGVYQINAFEQADFDNFSISKHRLITERDIAPWRPPP
ncbi:FecR domain-containing protein [Nitrosomonas supralitoralis]|uniref:Iron dicitrate transport regulator FecR n=1 Tax=Nitrosomonas supralitoralis TaxID=2116706 RepID=A0A2P7NRW9_9PROT|nr:FecR domain-containing protein [Nitrosomonas supralitoralis]PSJ16231.1 iron dicitrate transport regulator FecR [Nitrosomonas supralitoralis]